METRAEIEMMSWEELREFLGRHDVSVKSVKATGRTPRPLKLDLLNRALEIVTEHEDRRKGKEALIRAVEVNEKSAEKAEIMTPVKQEMLPEGTTPEKKMTSEGMVTPLRSRKTPVSRSTVKKTIRVRPTEEDATAPPAVSYDLGSAKNLAESAVRRLNLESIEKESPTSEKGKAKRKSTGWIDPSLLRVEEPVASEPLLTEEIVTTDTEGEPSDAERDSGADDLTKYTVPTLRRKLDDYGVRYSTRNKKSELIALLRASELRRQAEEPDDDDVERHRMNPRFISILAVVVLLLIVWASIWRYVSIHGLPRMTREFCDESSGKCGSR